MDMIDIISQYIDKYYISGIVNDTSYNPIDTITYAILLGISFFGVLKLLKKLDVKIDQQFITSIIPYILAGSSLRVLEDMNVFTPPLKYLFITPIIYFVVFAVTISFLAISVTIEKKGKIKDYHKFFSIFGILWTVFNIFALIWFGNIINPISGLVIIILGILSTGIIYFISKQLNFSILTNKLNISILFAHLLDASSTFIGMSWHGYYEKHFVPTFFIDITSNYIDSPAIIMFPLKILVFIPVIYVLDKEFDKEKEKELIALMKLAIIVLGLSPAIRNTLRIIMGV